MELKRILGTKFPSSIEHASRITDLLAESESDEDSADLMTYLISHGTFVVKNGTKDRGRSIAKDRIDLLTKEVGCDLSKIFHFWISKNPGESELGRKLWNYLKRLGGDKEKWDFAINFFLLERHIPYRTIPHGELIREVMPAIKKWSLSPESEEELMDRLAIFHNAIQRAINASELATIFVHLMNECSNEDKYTFVVNAINVLTDEAKGETWKEITSTLEGMIQKLETESTAIGNLIGVESFDNVEDVIKFLKVIQMSQGDGGKADA